MEVDGYSSDGSSSFSWKVDEWIEQLRSDSGLVVVSNEISDVNGGPIESLNYNQLNEVETTFATSCQTKARGGGRAKLTLAQKRENKRKSDYRYRQKRKMTADEQTAEIKHLKEENERLNDENRMLKEQIGLLLPNGQLPAADPQRHDSYITQSTGKQLEHQSVSVQDHHGSNSGAADRMIPVNVVATDDYVVENQKNSQAGTCWNDDAAFTDLLMKIEADDGSQVKFSDFTGLDGERITVGKYSFPLSLYPIVKKIIDFCGDISASSKMNPSIAETIYIMFCASVKEMNDLSLEQVNEGRLLKWRDVIKDALRMNFKVDFAIEHLKKIACACIGLMERQKLDNVAKRISKLKAELSAGKEEHARICEQSKVFMDAAEEFIGKPVSSGMFQNLPTSEMCSLYEFSTELRT